MRFDIEGIEGINLIGGAICSFFILILGPFWYLFMGLMVLNIVDWVTGWSAARKEGVETSEKGYKGIVKKVGYWVVIAIAFFISASFENMGELISVNLSFMNLLGWFTLSSYIVNEIRSILENLVRLNVDLPDFLTKGLKIADGLINKSADSNINKDETKEV